VVSSVLPSANVCVNTVPKTFTFRVPELGPCIVLELAGPPPMVLVIETRVVAEDEMVIHGRVKVWTMVPPSSEYKVDEVAAGAGPEREALAELLM